MERWRFTREFKLEAVKLVTERGVAIAQAARDLDISGQVPRRWQPSMRPKARRASASCKGGARAAHRLRAEPRTSVHEFPRGSPCYASDHRDFNGKDMLPHQSLSVLRCAAEDRVVDLMMRSMAFADVGKVKGDDVMGGGLGHPLTQAYDVLHHVRARSFMNRRMKQLVHPGICGALRFLIRAPSKRAISFGESALHEPAQVVRQAVFGR